MSDQISVLLRVVSVPRNPWTCVPAVDGAGLEDVLDYDLPNPAHAVIEKAAPGDLSCRECEHQIGLSEVVHEDDYGNETEAIVWRSLVVVCDARNERPEAAWVLCEDCAAGFA